MVNRTDIFAKWNDLNSNIQFMMIKSCFGGIGRSLYWFASAFLVYSLGGEHSAYGDISGIASIFGLITVLTAGYFSDIFRRRDILLWFGLGVEVLGLVFLSNARTLEIVLIGNILVNLALGFTSTSQTTIIADSTTSHQKNQIFAIYFLVENFAFGLGNIVAYFVFQNYGNEVALETLLIIIQIATVTIIIEFFISFKIRDYKSLTDQKSSPQTIDLNLESAKVSEEDTRFINRKFFFIPFIVTLSGYLVSFGAGISVIFFPIFFNEKYGLSLDFITLVFAVMIFVTGIWGKLMGDLADRYGRVKSIFVTQLLAVFLLYLLSTYPPLILAILTLLVRNAFMNAGLPVINALLTDNVPKLHRARWSALNVIGWTILFGLGNVLGGRIIDLLDYWAAFFTTATLYLLGILILLLIKEPKNEKNIEIN
ncbi:MAG: MFS transporter [Candidatus Hodarchaeales archaeon]